MQWLASCAAAAYTADMKFIKRSEFDASAEQLWAFHAAPDAFEKLQPPWQQSRIIRPPRSLETGTTVELQTKVGPIWQTIVAEHIAYEEGRMFVDTMRKGPFKKWVHHHVIEPLGPGRSALTDDIDYELPLGALGRVVGGPIARYQLERLFAFRHDVTRRALER